MNLFKHYPLHLMFTLVLTLGTFGCAKVVDIVASSTPNAPIPPAHLINGSLIVNAPIVGSGVSKGTITTATKTLSYTGVGMVRFNDPWSTVFTVPLGHYTTAADFGLNGSMTLVADTVGYPIAGGAYPVLVGFSVVKDSDLSTVEFVNTTAGCTTTGMWTCIAGSCSAQPTCSVQAPSGFAGRTDWDQHQIPPYGYTSANSFPHCDSTVAGWTSCPANLGTLPSGTYSAKYLLLSDSGSSTVGMTSGLNVRMTIKKDTAARNAGGTNGGINLNIILVGDKNVNDSHSTKGANNLNILLGEMNRLFSTQTGASIGINQVKVYEWTNANGGSQYSQIDFSLLGNLFQAGSQGVAPSDEGSYINVFIVSNIIYSAGGGFSILGLSGGILGPPNNGTQSSGLVFSSFDKLASFNPSCNSINCTRDKLENDFLEMGATMVHELGHYLGLNHPSEKPDSGGFQQVDQLSDTPTCTYRTSGATKYLDQRACYFTDATVQPAPLAGTSCQTACDAVTGATHYLAAGSSAQSIDPWTSYANADMPAKFCPAVKECQHNQVMWYTTKNRHLQNAGGNCTLGSAVAGLCTWSEDGNLFSPQSSAIIQWDAFLR